MYPISINLRAVSDLRASVCAHACLSIKETLCDGGGGRGGEAVSGAASDNSVDFLPPLHEVPGLWLHTVPYRFVTYE